MRCYNPLCWVKTLWYWLVRPQKRDYVKDYDMPSEHDKSFEFDGTDNRAINNLAKAIRQHAEATQKLTEHLDSNAINRCDLKETEDRLLDAIAGIQNTELSPQDQAILNDLSAVAEAGIKRLEALAALTPNDGNILPK